MPSEFHFEIQYFDFH